MSAGILIYGEGDEASRKVIYDTRLKRLQIQLNEGTNRLQVFQRNGGTGLVSNGTPATEILFETKHNLPFVPKVLFYILCRDAPALYATKISTYSGNSFYMPDGPTLPYYSLIYYQADKTSFRIVHEYNAPDTTPSGAPNWLFRFKYMITDTPELGT